MNILFLQSDTGKTGGISNYIRALTKNYHKDWNFHVNVSDLNEYSKLNYLNSQLHILPPTYSLISLFDYIIQLRKIISHHKIHIIHSHALRSGFISVLIKFFTRCYVVHTNHGLRFNQKKGIFNKAVFFLIEIFIILFCDYYICISKSNYFFFKRFLNLKKIKYIYTKIDISPTLDLQIRKSTLDTKKIKIIGIGSILPVKRLDNFLNIAKELLILNPNLHIEWFGTGLYLNYFKEYSQRFNITIKWRGNISNADLIDEISNATALLVTSEYEVMPLSVLECFSAGVLVFSNDFQNVKDFIIDNQTGIIINTNNSYFSANKILEVLNDSEKYLKLILNANNYFIKNHYNSKLMSDEYFQLYKKLCFQY